ncbi:MAG: hypothetical protein E6Q97_36230 [Desulfurellales bacterium]|nr:MAG: hypothetical protein E6Q97_36230 [Desulfurellales bacterium]
MSNLMGSVGPLSRNPFDDLEFAENVLRPLWTVEGLDDPTKEKDVLEWMKTSIEVCQSWYRDYFQVQMDNLLLYKGVQWLNQDRYSSKILDRHGVPNRRSPRIVLNHLSDFTEQWVSRLTRYRPAVAIFPSNTEWQDEQDARVSKMVLDHIWYQNVIDLYFQEFARQGKIFGESFLYQYWDPMKGDLHPDYVKVRDFNKRQAVLDQYGQPIMGESGKGILKIQKPIKIGDIGYRIDAPWHWFEDPKKCKDDVEWAIRWSTVDKDYLKAKHPEKAHEISTDSGEDAVFSNYHFEIGRLKNEVIVYELFHRHSEFLETGRYIKCTKKCILENTVLPYSHGKLPYVKFTDIDIPDNIRGMSFFQQLFPLQHQINACASLIYKALVLFAHPKIVMPEGSCDIQQLLNESTILSYAGGVAPTIMNNPVVPQELFSYLNKLEETAEKLSGIFSMSRGQAPSGVRAAKAMRVLEEQEDKRAFITVTKFNQSIVETAKLTLAIAGEYYDDSDGRLARVVGKDNEYEMIAFKSANLSKSYDVRVETTTALSQSTAARLEELNEMATLEFSPNSLVSREQYIALTDLGRSDEFKDIATRAVRAAKTETQQLLSGVAIPDPTADEDLITHWKIHLQIVQSIDFKMGRVPPEFKAKLIEHVTTTEWLMFKKAYGIMDSFGMPMVMPNEAFKQKLLVMCPEFPVYFVMPVPTMATGLAGGFAGPQPQEVPPAGAQEAAPIDANQPPAPDQLVPSPYPAAAPLS